MFIFWLRAKKLKYLWRSAGSAEAAESPVLLPAAARRSDPSQQGASAEDRHVRQAHAQEQTQDQEDGEAADRPQHLPQMRRTHREGIFFFLIYFIYIKRMLLVPCVKHFQFNRRKSNV